MFCEMIPCLRCGEQTKNPKFCGSSCAAKYNNSGRVRSEESKKLTAATMRAHGIVPGPTCKNTGARWAKPPDKNWIAYKASAAFYTPKYIWPYLDGYELIELIGWHDPITNVDGVERDHLFSVKAGWDNGVDVSIIRHPANCRLTRARANRSKGASCLISLDELMVRIFDLDARLLAAGIRWRPLEDSNP